MTARAMLERFTSDYAKNFINYSSPAYDALFQQAINATGRGRPDGSVQADGDHAGRTLPPTCISRTSATWWLCARTWAA